MRISHSLFLIACLVGGTATAAWADDVYVCKIRVETGFQQLSDTGFAESAQMKINALLMTKPYCQGTSAGSMTLTTPMLERVRKRKQVIEHMSKARNVWQAAVATFLEHHGIQASVDAGSLASVFALKDLSLWPEGDEEGVVRVDFTAPGVETQYLICVGFDRAGAVVEVAMES